MENHSELFQNNDETSKLTEEDLMNKKILSPIILNSDILFIILSVSSETSIFKSLEIYEFSKQLGVFTIVIAQMPPSLEFNEQRILNSCSKMVIT